MAQYLIQGETLTAIADEVRELSGSTDKISISTLISNLDEANTEVGNQADLIAQIKAKVENLPNAGSGSSEDLEALGVLCSWDVMTNDSSYPVITIYNRHPTYYLKCTIYNDNDIPADFDNGSGTAAVGGAVTVEPDDWATFIIEDTFIDNSSTVYIDDVRWTKNV